MVVCCAYDLGSKLICKVIAEPILGSQERGRKIEREPISFTWFFSMDELIFSGEATLLGNQLQ